MSYFDNEFEVLNRELNKLLSEFHIPEGGSYQIPDEVLRLKYLVERQIPSSIMEIGFNTGHSALLFLAITPPHVKVVSFDLGEYTHVFVAKRFIDKKFPGRHTLVTGDSRHTVPNYEDQVAHRMNSKNPPPLKFDFIFVDGGHQGNIPHSDLLNSYRLVSGEKNVVVIDDISRDPSRQAHYTIEPTKAWETLKEIGMIREEGYDDYYHTGKCPKDCDIRGLAWGSYIVNNGTQANSSSDSKNSLIYMQIQNNYKYMDRMQMVTEIDRLYNQEKNYEKLVALADMYLEYFADFNKRDANYIRFYRACGNYVLHPKTAIKQYEEIVDMPQPGPNAEHDEFPDHIRHYSICNLGQLYSRVYNEEYNEEIPKIIHILFFGETDFYNFHHRCIHSMLQYMPDYEIWIHNSKEPVNNKYWDDIKKHITIKKTEVPQQYDGYDLKYFQYKADVLRLEVLYNYGGVYLDLDMLIVKPFHDVFKSGHSFYISKEKQGQDCLINAFLASKPKNEFIKLWLNEFKCGLRLGIWAHHIRDSNKKLLDEHPHYMHKYKIKLLEGNIFMPLHWTDGDTFSKSERVPYEFPVESYGTHLWETILGDIMKKNQFLNKQKIELDVYNNKESLFYVNCDTKQLEISDDYYHIFRNDQFLNQYITNGKRCGYFIEIGAGDGIESSSCYYFEKNMDWNGLAVEPAKTYKESITKNRINPIFLAVSKITSSSGLGMGGATFYENDCPALCGIKDALESNKNGHDWCRFGRKEYNVDTITLYDLCSKQNSPEYIDYCAVDCEGSEYDVLETFFIENRLFDLNGNGGNGGNGDDSSVELVVTNKVFHIDVFSIKVNNYDKIRTLMENNGYEEIENPFLKIITFNGQEVTWEKYFKNKTPYSPRISNNVPPQTDLVVQLNTVNTAKFLILPPFAEEVVVICIEERPERIKYVSDHLLSFGVKHTLLLNNIHPTNTKIGCFQSHIKAIEYALSNNLSSVLIVEDDIIIRDNITELANIALPIENWDILYLGGILTKFDKMDTTNNWVKGTIWCNHAYLVKRHMYEPILEFVHSYPNLNELESKNIDYLYTEYIQPKYDCWLANDQYIIQKEGYSEIDGRLKWTGNFDWSTFSMKVI
jgi:FkbM family methyltransferase